MLNSKGFDEWAAGYDASVRHSHDAGEYPFAGYDAVLSLIEARVNSRPGADVLDLGFGTGMLTARLYAAGHPVAGVDFSQNMLDAARTKMPCAELYLYDFTRGLPPALEGRTFDFIISTYAFHHVPDAGKPAFLLELSRRLSPGGSSSGTAAAVAAGYCPGGLGTDTGGSIRLPAGWCGLYGIRSTQGQSDISGIYPRAASLDTVGAMARSARDIDLLLQILADPPLRDTLRASAPIRYLRIGVFPDLVRAKGSPEVIEAYAEAVGRWEEFGECIPVGLPLLDDPAVVDSVGTIRSYEFARDIRKDIEGNPFAGKMHPVPLADYKNGQQAAPEAYHAALLHKQALSRQVDAFFASLQVDFLLLPVAFSTAPSIDAPQEAFTAGRTLVNLFSIAGVPTLVVPGELTAAGMPLGIQLVGPALSERLLLDAGTAYETTYGPFPAPPLVSA